MTITREINGTTINLELTQEEMYKAYYEQQHRFDLEDVKEIAGWLEEDGAEPFTKEEIESASKELREDYLDDKTGEITHDIIYKILNDMRK